LFAEAGMGRYVGGFRAGRRHGTGSQTYANGSVYMGEWVNNQRHGYGAFQNTEQRTVYVGDWADDAPQGSGVLRDSDMRWIYCGEMAAGQPHGHGAMQYADHSRYIGAFETGKRHGRGAHLLASGDCYDGLWEGDFRHGNGMLLLRSSNTVYSGVWRNDTIVRCTEAPATSFVIPVALTQPFTDSATDFPSDMTSVMARKSSFDIGGASSARSFAAMPPALPKHTLFTVGMFGGITTKFTMEYVPVDVQPSAVSDEIRQQAALGYIQDAMEARSPHGRDGKTRAQLAAYAVQRNRYYRFVLVLLSCALCLVTVVLEPVSYLHVSTAFPNAHRTPLMIFELIGLVILLLDCALRFFHIACEFDAETESYRVAPMRFVRQWATSISTLCTFLLIVDVIMSLCIPVTAVASSSNIRWARVLRPIIVVCRVKSLRQLARLILLTLPVILDLLGLIIAIMFVFAIVGSTLFAGLYTESTTDSFEGIIRYVRTHSIPLLALLHI
jgi:hypothetical protein